MIDKQIIILLSLAILAVATLADSNAKTFREKWIEWGKNPHINQFGEFVDVDTECDGKPCNYPEDIVPFSSKELSGPFCIPAGNDKVICNYLPENATLVPESAFDREFSGSSRSSPKSHKAPTEVPFSKGSGPEPSQASQVSLASKVSVPQPSQTSQLLSVSKRSIPKPSQASRPRLASRGTFPKHAKFLSKLEKRSRFILEGSEHYVWGPKARVTYRVAFEDALRTEKLKLESAVSNGFEYLKGRCGVAARSLFQNWTPLTQESSLPTANIWFYFVKGVVCESPAAFACAFFPYGYRSGKRTVVYVNWDKFKGKSSKGISMIMAHEIGHLLGLAHENIDKNPNNGIPNSGSRIPLFKVSPYDDKSIMHSYHDITKEATATDCRALSFLSNDFENMECGLVGEEKIKCKKFVRFVVPPRDVTLNTKEQLVQAGSSSLPLLEDVADYSCTGSDMSQYILNTPIMYSHTPQHGYFQRGFVITQCLGVQVPGYAYVMQSDGNFVSYNLRTGKAVWSTGSQGKGTHGDYDIIFQDDGNLVIYDIHGKPIWSTNTFDGSDDNFRIKISDVSFGDGKLSLASADGRAAYSSSDAMIAYRSAPIQPWSLDGGVSNFCLDVGKNREGEDTKLEKCNGSENQKWNVHVDGMISAVKSSFSLCLTASKNTNGGIVYLASCAGGYSNQKWKLHNDGTIRNEWSGQCLDNSGQQLVAGNRIQTWACADALSVKWWVDKN
jgi:hypothetical protein